MDWKLSRVAKFEGKRPSYHANPDMKPGSQKVLATFLNADGTIRQVPNSRTQPVKFRIVLEYLSWPLLIPVWFTPKRKSTASCAAFNEDVSGLRRDLIDAKMLARERDGSKYWRSPEPAERQPE